MIVPWKKFSEASRFQPSFSFVETSTCWRKLKFCTTYDRTINYSKNSSTKYEISYIGLKNVKNILYGLKTSSATGKHEGKGVFLRDPTLFQLLQLGQNLFLPSHFPEFLFCFCVLIVVFGRNKFWEAGCMKWEEPWKEDGNLEKSMKTLKGGWKPPGRCLRRSRTRSWTCKSSPQQELTGD